MITNLGHLIKLGDQGLCYLNPDSILTCLCSPPQVCCCLCFPVYFYYTFQRFNIHPPPIHSRHHYRLSPCVLEILILLCFVLTFVLETLTCALSSFLLWPLRQVTTTCEGNQQYLWVCFKAPFKKMNLARQKRTPGPWWNTVVATSCSGFNYLFRRNWGFCQGGWNYEQFQTPASFDTKPHVLELTMKHERPIVSVRLK